MTTFGVKPFRYYGGKARLAPTIVSMMPEHHLYLEPFLGSAAVFCAKPTSRHELVNDLDDNLVTFFRVLRDHPDELTDALRFTPYARTEYIDCRDDPRPSGADDIEVARRFFTVVSQSFAATTGSAAGWSASIKKNVNRARSWHHQLDRLHIVAERFKNVQIECRPAWEVIDAYTADLGAATVIYCDPPYVHDTRKSGSYGYRHEMTDADHRRLAQSLHLVDATVLLSGYHGELYDEIYTDWHVHEISTYTTVGGENPKNAERSRRRTEVVWSNRPLNTQLDWLSEATG